MTNFMDIGVLTRHRSIQLRTCVNSAIATVGCPAQVTIAFDDDRAGYESCVDWPGTSHLLLRPRHYYVRGVNALFHHMRRLAHEQDRVLDYFCILNNDVEFVRGNWGPAGINYLSSKFPDGMGLVELVGPDVLGNYISRAALFDEHFGGRIAEPCYTMYFSDSELLNRLKQMGRYSHADLPSQGSLPDKILQHHVVHDSLRSEAFSWFPVDRQVYDERAKLHGWELSKEDTPNL